MVNMLPVDTWEPPQLPVYQYTVPTAPFAVSNVPNPLQIGFAEAVTEEGLNGPEGIKVKPVFEPVPLELVMLTLPEDPAPTVAMI